MQRVARDAYAASLKRVFMFAATSTFLAYLVRLPVRFHCQFVSFRGIERCFEQVPGKHLEKRTRSRAQADGVQNDTQVHHA